MRAESEGVNKGSRFIVRLPVRSAERQRDVRPAASPAAQVPLTTQLAGTTVVVVDDDRDTRELLESVLTSAGATVHLAATADEGFRLCVEESPDAIISDIAMPTHDGYDFIRRLRALPPERGGALPVIALTAFARSEDERAALKAGFQAHIAKPVEMADLARAAARLVQEKNW